MLKKLKTKLEFEFDKSIDLGENFEFDIIMKERKLVVIKEVKLPKPLSKRKQQDSSTKLF